MTAWEELRETCLKCQACQLRQTCTQVVFGVGDPNAEVLFIGEAPGANEDAQGEPFVGRAGKLLDDMLAMIGLHRQNIYITNSVKCRPPIVTPTPIPVSMDFFARFFFPAPIFWETNDAIDCISALGTSMAKLTILQATP